MAAEPEGEELADELAEDTAEIKPEPPAGSVIRWPMLAFMTIACAGSIAQLPAAASFGLGAITLYLLPALLFLLPVALVSAEMATGWQGGVFVWVREGINERMGFQAIWLQWIQSVALYPSLLSFAAASLAYAFGAPGLASNGLFTGVVILVVFWAATMVAWRGIGATAKLSSGALLVGTLMPAASLILLMVVWLVSGRASSTPLEVDKIVPPFTGIGSIVLVVSNFIAFAGLEVNAVHVRRMRNPRRNYPKAIAVACAAILLMYVPGSIAISVAVPSSALDLNAGAPQAFHIFADEFGVGWLGNVLSGALVFGALAAAATWVAGPSRGLLLVGRQGLLPRPLQRVNEAGAQTAILVVQGCIVTVLALLFVALPDVSSAFWVLQAMTAVLYLTMYVLLFTTAVRLRTRHPEVPRGIRVPAIRLVATAGALASIAGIVIALFPPAQFGNEPVAQYAAILVVGVTILGLPPQLIYRLRRPSWRTDVEIEPEPDPVEPDEPRLADDRTDP